ncbi:carbonic anhydrase [Photobacterium makurazakiensis]|uniref:carbonic anhydrase family protein n=1 Tax=Photobacterium makurazakiensis TaxID=2910234 RepID=UPI003D0C5186
MCCNKINESRRNILKGSIASAGFVALGGTAGLLAPSVSYAASLSQADRDAMTTDDVLSFLKEGNNRFINDKALKHDYKAQKLASQHGQYPAAVILSCIDSRAPAEIILDAGIGDVFNSRVAGNIANSDILGSMEFACAVAGAKVVLVLGHTKCGAVQGAIANAELENLTGLLDKIKPAIAKTEYAGEKSADNYDFVDAVAKTNVLMTVENIRAESNTLRELEAEGKIKIVGAMYNLSNGHVDFIS